MSHRKTLNGMRPISPPSTCHSAPVCQISSRSNRPRQKKWRHVDFQKVKVKGKGKWAYSSSWNSPQNYGTPLVNGITQRYLPPDRGNPSVPGWYSIYRPRKDERLSWPSWLVTYRNGLPVQRRSPTRVLTGSDVAQLRWSKPTCYH